MALSDVPLELFWDIKTLLASAAFACFFQLPFITSREAGTAAIFAPFMNLHVAMERAGGKEASAAHRALVGFVGGVSFHVDFEVITAGEGRVTLTTVVLLVAGVELHVTISAALVLEQAAAKGAAEREFITVTLFVALEET